LWGRNSTAPQLPASTAKLLTGAASRTSVNPTVRFVTRVVDGDQAADIVLVGGGDVTLAARKPGCTIRSGDPATKGETLAGLLGVPDIPVVNGAAPGNGVVIGQVSSQPIAVLLAQALERSDNVLAEALGRQVAIARGAPPSFAVKGAAIAEALTALGIDTTIGAPRSRTRRDCAPGTGGPQRCWPRYSRWRSTASHRCCGTAHRAPRRGGVRQPD